MRYEREKSSYLAAFDQLRDQGKEWTQIQEFGTAAAEHDERYLARRQFQNKLLGLIGIERPLLPERGMYPSSWGIWIILDDLERAGQIEGRFVENGAEHRPREYRLVPAQHSEIIS